MKKRSMLAIASLATGCVVAAITPSHGHGAGAPGSLDADDAVSTLDRMIADHGPAADGRTPGQGGRADGKG